MSEQKKKYEYVTPVDQLDELLRKIEKGNVPMVPELVQMELVMRKQELMEEYYDEDENEQGLTVNIQKEHNVLKAKLEKEKRKARKQDIIVMDFDEDFNEKIRNEMKVSFIRDDYKSDYNKTEEELCGSSEKIMLTKRIKNIKPLCYNTKDYKEAFDTLIDVINYVVEHEYPWLTKDEVLRDIKSGKIQLNKWIKIPKLVINGFEIVTDANILREAAKGNVEIKSVTDDRYDHTERTKQLKREHKIAKMSGEGISYDNGVVDTDEMNQMRDMDKMGYFTPMDLFNKAPITYSSTYFNNLLGSMYNTQYNNSAQDERLDKLRHFDWTTEDAGKQYYQLLNGINPNNIENLIRGVKAANPGVSSGFIDTLRTSLTMCEHGMTSYNHWNMSYDDILNQDRQNRIADQLNQASMIEQNLLNSMRKYNSNLNV